MSLSTPAPVSVFIALGSNLGDSRRILLDAMARLQDFCGEPMAKSSLWQTTPVDCPPGSPKFLNAVVRLVPRPGETPETLLAKLQSLEKEFGRETKKVLNEPRPLDLDLIAFGNETRHTPGLILPHPRASQRKFSSSSPLTRLAPDLIIAGASEGGGRVCWRHLEVTKQSSATLRLIHPGSGGRADEGRLYAK